MKDKIVMFYTKDGGLSAVDVGRMEEEQGMLATAMTAQFLIPMKAPWRAMALTHAHRAGLVFYKSNKHVLVLKQPVPVLRDVVSR